MGKVGYEVTKLMQNIQLKEFFQKNLNENLFSSERKNNRNGKDFLNKMLRIITLNTH